MLHENPLISIVIPIYNEVQVLPETLNRLEGLRALFDGHADLEFVFIDDGSKDESGELIQAWLCNEIRGALLVFSRNFGHQIAISAGIDHAKGDFVAVIDADLQDPPELIFDMFEKAKEGYHIVYGKRRTRQGESWFKLLTAKIFYKVMHALTDIDIPTDTGDFRLISRQVADNFKQMRERHRFVRGMIPWLGFKAYALEYDREKRFAGETKYPLRKRVKFAGEAIVSFSSRPLGLAVRLGVFFIMIGLIGLAYILYLKLFTDIVVAGLTTILFTIVAFSGLQVFLIGIVGSYIALIFESSKKRPLYVIATKIEN